MKRIILLPSLVLLATACAETTAPDTFQPQFVVNETYGVAQGGTTVVFPSTNEANAGKRWAYVEFIDIEIGSVTLKFYQPRTFAACFERRIDEEPPTDSRPNFNPAVTDGMWAFVCLNNGTTTLTIPAGQFVDIRMAFGAESDERFDWTRFYAPTKEESKQMCKDGAWESSGFKNIGQCVRFAETGVDSR